MHILILNTLQNIGSRFMKYERSYCNARNLGSVLSVEINLCFKLSVLIIKFISSLMTPA